MIDGNQSYGSDENLSGQQLGDEGLAAERQAEFRARYEANRLAGNPPYAGVQIRTRGELLWIMHERRWSGEDTDFSVERANLAQANLEGAQLGPIRLFRANLSGSIMDGANLEGAELKRVNLSNAHLWHVHLHGADLYRVDLSGAHLWRADLSSTKLDWANLTGAHLQEANLRAADLRGSRMDSGTDLFSVVLDQSTAVGDVVWNGAPLLQVRWEKARILGDERHTDPLGEDIRERADELVARAGWSTEAISSLRRHAARNRRIRATRAAARAYRGLVIAMRQQGLLVQASHYRLREQRLERRALRLERRYASWLFSALLDLIAGYGERPWRTVTTYVMTVLGFASLYFGIMGEWDSSHAVDAIVYSLTSFHGRGFLPGLNVVPHNPIVVLAAVEAVTGLFIELIMIATITRRLLGD